MLDSRLQVQPPGAPAGGAAHGWRAELPGVAALVGVAVLQALILVIRHRTYFAAPDNTTQFWAWYQKAAAVLHNGSLPLWDQNTLSGHSFVGETQTGVFYPPNLVWLLVFGGAQGIGTRALDLLSVAHLLLASVGFYALCRSFSVGRTVAVTAGVVFAYTGVVDERSTAQTAIFFGLTLLPWALFFAHRQLETGRLRFAVGAGAAIGLAVLAGHFQPPFHAAMLVALFYLLTFPRPERTWRQELSPRLKGAGITGGVAVLVALPQLAYSLPYFNRAYRFIGAGPPLPPGAKVSFSTFTHLYTGGPDSILSLLDPQRYPIPEANSLFIGLTALAILILGAITAYRSIWAQMGRYRWALIGTALVGTLAILGPWTPFPIVLYQLPLVAEVRELGRYSILVEVVLCLLFAFALQAVARQWADGAGARPRWVSGLYAAGGLVAMDGIYLIVRTAPGSSHWFGIELLLGGLALLILAGGARLGSARLLLALALVILVSSLHSGLRSLGSTSSPLYPSRYYARTPAITYAERACAGHRTVVLDGALPVNVGDVFRGLHTQNGYGATMHVPYYDFISTVPWNSPEGTRLLDLRCIVTRQPLTLAGYRLAYRDASGVLIYVNLDTSALNTVGLDPVPAENLSRGDRHLRYRFYVSRPTTLILSALVYPGWKLSVDGHRPPTGAFRVHGVAVFPEVTVGPGAHTLDYSWSGWPA